MIKVSSNGFFLTPDAEVYASMILDRRPRRIIEVGSGFQHPHRPQGDSACRLPDEARRHRPLPAHQRSSCHR